MNDPLVQQQSRILAYFLREWFLQIWALTEEEEDFLGLEKIAKTHNTHSFVLTYIKCTARTVGRIPKKLVKTFRPRFFNKKYVL